MSLGTGMVFEKSIIQAPHFSFLSYINNTELPIICNYKHPNKNHCGWNAMPDLSYLAPFHSGQVGNSNLSWMKWDQVGLVRIKNTALPIICKHSNKFRGVEYKNLSWVWGWGRKICPEDRRLASRGLPTLTRIMDSFSCSPLFLFIYVFIYFKISFQKSLNTLRCNFTWWRYLTSWVR